MTKNYSNLVITNQNDLIEGFKIKLGSECSPLLRKGLLRTYADGLHSQTNYLVSLLQWQRFYLMTYSVQPHIFDFKEPNREYRQHFQPTGS